MFFFLFFLFLILLYSLKHSFFLHVFSFIQVSTAYGIDQTHLKHKEATPNLSQEIIEKSKILDELHGDLKEKIATVGYKQKIQILTLAPDQWSRNACSQIFGVSEYLVRKARELKKLKGILAYPDSKVGRILNADTTDAVQKFY